MKSSLAACWPLAWLLVVAEGAMMPARSEAPFPTQFYKLFCHSQDEPEYVTDMERDTGE